MHPSSIKVDKRESLLVSKLNGKQLSIKQFGKVHQCNGRSCSIDTQREITKILTTVLLIYNFTFTQVYTQGDTTQVL